MKRVSRWKGAFRCRLQIDKVVSPSIDVHNIKGSLLLEADLKGYIENAGWYFAGEEEERMEALDLLLSTQGWRRFSWQEIATTQPKTGLSGGEGVSTHRKAYKYAW